MTTVYAPREGETYLWLGVQVWTVVRNRMLSRLAPVKSNATSAEDGGMLGAVTPRASLALGCDSLPEAF